ncbi:RHG27 protein, partial [Pachycephala philippinensis]|nr:RHG27 protein [Pachycephala philippinensis]
AGPAEEALVLVEYGFEYRAKDGTLVSIKPNERYVLLKRTNPHWWHVRRSGDARPFYIPAQYVKELPPIAAPAPLDPPPSGRAATEPATLVPQPPPAYEDSVPRRDSLLQRDSPPSLSSFRVLPGLSPHPAEPVRPSQSLDDLARVTPAPRGATAMGARGDPPGHARPLGKSRSETLCASGKDRDVARRRPGAGPAAQTSDPIYLNIQELREEAAAASSAPEEPGGSVSDWETHTDTDSGHLFYYNPVTGETTWDCPFGQAADGVSPAASPASSLAHSPELPEWEQHVDQGSGQTFFYNSVTGETSWDPPSAGDTGSPQEMHPGGTRYGPAEQRPPTPEADYPDLSPDELECYPEEDYSPVGSYDQGASLCLSPRRPEELGSPPGWYGHSHPEGIVFYPEHFAPDTGHLGHHLTPPCPGAIGRPPRAGQQRLQPGQRAPGLAQHRATGSGQQGGEGEHPARGTQPAPTLSPGRAGARFDTPTFTFQFKSLEKAGVLNRTKTLDRGKRLRKNWSSSWTVLEGGILTFFKDSKHSAASALRHPSTLTTPEHTVELRGATLTWAGRDKSSKKNVLELRTREGSEFLIQHDSEQIITAWHRAIADSIGRRVSRAPPPRPAATPGTAPATPCPHPCPTLATLLVSPGRAHVPAVFPDQVFGCSLLALCERERGTVPHFVLQCIQTVERRGLDIDGLYRVSGNLATIQKLRYKVEHGTATRGDSGDSGVGTGMLWPPEPASSVPSLPAEIQDPSLRGRCIRDLVLSLPPAHHDTMKVLFRHLCRVVEHKEENRMSVQSVAIVFGPTLLRPASEEASMAMHMVFQNQVVEHILNHYGYIFPDG